MLSHSLNVDLLQTDSGTQHMNSSTGKDPRLNIVVVCFVVDKQNDWLGLEYANSSLTQIYHKQIDMSTADQCLY